jgi:hypothetical protein
MIVGFDLAENGTCKIPRSRLGCFRGLNPMSTTPTATTSKATVPSIRKSIMRIASESTSLGDGIDTLVEEVVQNFDYLMIEQFPEIKWEGEGSKLDRRRMILDLLAEKGLARRVNEKGKWIWKATTQFIRHLGPVARKLQPVPARQKGKDNAILPRVQCRFDEHYQKWLSQIFDREYKVYISLMITFLKMRRGGELVRFRKNGQIRWTTAELAPSVPEAQQARL